MRRRIADAVFRGSVYRRPEIGLCVPASLEPVVWTWRRHVAKRIWGKKKETPVGLSGTRVCVIGLAGCGRGVGTSHLAISLANYLTGVKRKKTALLEWNDHGDFERIGRFAGKEWRETDQSRNKGEVFRIMEVDYYKMADPSVLSFCLGRDYHYIILDYGEVTESSLCECARCDRKILVGSLSEWKAEAFLEVLEQAGNRDESWRMAVVSGGEDTRREIEKLFRCRLQRLPASADAFRITREEIPCFEDLLFARRGRAR